jgi:HK97 family phage major capsid protein
MPTPTTVELREKLLEHGDKARELREMPREQRGDTWGRDIAETRDAIYALDAEMRVAESIEYADMLVELRSGLLIPGVGPQAGTSGFGLNERRSAGVMFVEHDDYSDWAQRGARGESPAIMIERRNLVSTVVNADGGSLLPQGQPFIATGSLSRRRLFVRDVIAGGTTTLNSVPYVRELNPRSYELGASAVAEASAKPEVTLLFEPVDAPVRTIAAWVPVTRQVLEDAPTMRSYIDGRLGYMVELREEEEMLNGPGTGARLLGILNTTGVQTQAFTTDKPTSLGLAVSKVEMVDLEADGVAINPVDFWSMATTRYANQFDNGFGNSPSLPFGDPPQTIWGLPTIRSRSIPLNTAVVGAWRMGAQVFDRSEVEIRVTDSHSDLFIKNQLVILAESRLALAVHRPDAFVKVTMS